MRKSVACVLFREGNVWCPEVRHMGAHSEFTARTPHSDDDGTRTQFTDENQMIRNNVIGAFHVVNAHGRSRIERLSRNSSDKD